MVFICLMAAATKALSGKVNSDVRVMEVRSSTFKAAVYAHDVYIPIAPYVVSRAQALRNMEINLETYRTQVDLARQQVQRLRRAGRFELYGQEEYQFNTDVAYGPDGKFLAKYHKYNLYNEGQFDTPSNPEHAFFDTPFGRVGLATCFDILFREPIVSLVEEFNVTIIAFPTAWMDALPLLPAIGFHSSFARAHGVNLLAANIQLPLFKFDGSGLYAPDGARAFYYSKRMSPKLLVASMDVVRSPQGASSLTITPQQSVKHFFASRSSQLDEVFGVKKARGPIGDHSIADNNSTFESELFNDMYTFQALVGSSGKLQMCQGKLCCYIEYQIDTTTLNSVDEELFAFGAFDGLHTYDGNYYMQNCVLVKCADTKKKKSCGSLTTTASTVFTKISLRGEFQTKYVYPQVILSDDHDQLALTRPEAWTFDGKALETSASFSSTVLNAILLGRDYSRDKYW
ncbi:pantetheinase [Elysia marginata]|uniref:Pantetheinase n=1 Tax=Elysia marginata TaxID=1093978 RepID=A0AAV4I3Z0_9GAST|nr:pantetheinase [Elysia marginata]